MPHTQANIIEISHVQQISNQVALNVMHWRLDPVFPEQDFAALVGMTEEAHNRWELFAPLLSEDWSLLGTIGRVIVGKANVDVVAGTGTLVYGDQYEFIGGGATPGELTTDRLPTYAAVRTIKRTNRAGRRYRGAARIAGLVEAQTTADIINDDVRVNLQIVADGYMAPIVFPPFSGAQWVPVVFSKKDYFQQAAVTDPGSFSGDITRWLIRFVLGTQNSRKQPGNFAIV